MPIYCFKCDECGKVVEDLFPMGGAPSQILHVCSGMKFSVPCTRHLASELSAAHTDAEFHFRPHYDAGAGEFFDKRSQQRAFQARNVDEDGSVPEPVEGVRKKAMIEEAMHANHINKKPDFDDKAFTAELQRCYDETHEDLSKRAAMGLAPPKLDQTLPTGYREGLTSWTE